MKNVLKIEKNEELNYEFGKQNPTSTKLVGFFVCALRHFILPAGKGDGRQCVSRGDTLYLYGEVYKKIIAVYLINNRGGQVRLRYFCLLLYPQ